MADLEPVVRELDRVLQRHLGECTESNKTIFATLKRIEKRIEGSNNRFLGWVIGTQGAALAAIFAAWLGHQYLGK